MIKPERKSFGEGIAISALGVLILTLIPSQIQVFKGMETVMSPSFLPTIIGIILIALGAGLILQSFRKPLKLASQKITKAALIRAVVSIGLLILYAVFFSYIGFVVTSALFLGLFAFLFGSRSIPKTAFTMVLIPTLVWLCIEKLFNIPLPHGILF
ncbi:MAG TPA: tripartite tricarboxylate transporter TctB family protein [Spirochaetia bacterium]|nr:tripartite tricarboxylate transporter TctB family protein [Spirochaetia bacterium]